MAATVDITRKVAEVVLGKVPQTDPDVPFVAWDGTRLDTTGPHDSQRERMVRVDMARRPETTKYFGSTSVEVVDVLLVTTTHLQRADDATAFGERLDSDREDVIAAVQAQGTDWPAALVTIYPAAEGAEAAPVTEGAALWAQVIPFRVTYQVS